MEEISRELIFYGRNFAFYWVTVRWSDGTTAKWVQAVELDQRIAAGNGMR